MKQLLIRCLLLCFPGSWRRRYGEEFAALLEQAPFNPTQVLDALRSGIDARWRQWMPGPLSGGLGEDERRFWRRWVLSCAIAGGTVGLISMLVIPTLVLAGKGDPSTGYMLWQRALLSLPFLGLVTLAIGIAQWRALHSILPTLSRWWVVGTLFGPLAALLVIAPPRDYRMLPDLWTMSQSFLAYLSEVTRPSSEWGGSAYDWGRVFLWPTIYFGGIVAALQAYVLKGTLQRAGWWIGVAMMASVAGLATARALSPLQAIPDYQILPKVINPGQLSLDIALTTGQVGAACAVYGIVSGLGLITLRRAGQPAPEPGITAA